MARLPLLLPSLVQSITPRQVQTPKGMVEIIVVLKLVPRRKEEVKSKAEGS